MRACLSVRKDLECSFHHCGGPMKLINANLCVTSDPKNIFHHCGSHVKLRQGS